MGRKLPWAPEKPDAKTLEISDIAGVRTQAAIVQIHKSVA